MEFSDLELVNLWHNLNRPESSRRGAGVPERALSMYTVWDRIDEEVKARNIDPQAWTKTETIPATTKTIKL